MHHGPGAGGHREEPGGHPVSQRGSAAGTQQRRYWSCRSAFYGVLFFVFFFFSCKRKGEKDEFLICKLISLISSN